MTNTHHKSSATDLTVATAGDAVVDARVWAARRLRFEALLGSLERQAGLMSDTDRSRRP